jgi:hypothetical protein
MPSFFTLPRFCLFVFAYLGPEDNSPSYGRPDALLHTRALWKWYPLHQETIRKGAEEPQRRNAAIRITDSFLVVIVPLHYLVLTYTFDSSSLLINSLVRAFLISPTMSRPCLDRDIRVFSNLLSLFLSSYYYCLLSACYLYLDSHLCQLGHLLLSTIYLPLLLLCVTVLCLFLLYSPFRYLVPLYQ